ncbi:MAG TPA: metalloregulator ArsR/SmtB family transcription factor [Thermoanaerobaculia bacterium]|nr:metalloregulator ArsR/SmtB family transcription factor [Thermoanaerobaculia bacterium]
MNEAAVSDSFKALADPTRVRILALLKQRGQSCCGLIGKREPGLCACDIQQNVGLSQSVVNHHMQILIRAGLVTGEKRGRWVYYRRNDAAIAALADMLARAV